MLYRCASTPTWSLPTSGRCCRRSSLRPPSLRHPPQLVYSDHSFGLTGRRLDLALGPHRRRQAASWTSREPDSPPQKVGTPARRLLAGMDGAFGVSPPFDGSARERQRFSIIALESMTLFPPLGGVVPWAPRGAAPGGGRGPVIAGTAFARPTPDHARGAGQRPDVPAVLPVTVDRVGRRSRLRRNRPGERRRSLGRIQRSPHRPRSELLEAFAPRGARRTDPHVADSRGARTCSSGALFSIPSTRFFASPSRDGLAARRRPDVGTVVPRCAHSGRPRASAALGDTPLRPVICVSPASSRATLRPEAAAYLHPPARVGTRPLEVVGCRVTNGGRWRAAVVHVLRPPTRRSGQHLAVDRSATRPMRPGRRGVHSGGALVPAEWRTAGGRGRAV